MLLSFSFRQGPYCVQHSYRCQRIPSLRKSRRESFRWGRAIVSEWWIAWERPHLPLTQIYSEPFSLYWLLLLVMVVGLTYTCHLHLQFKPLVGMVVLCMRSYLFSQLNKISLYLSICLSIYLSIYIFLLLLFLLCHVQIRCSYSKNRIILITQKKNF